MMQPAHRVLTSSSLAQVLFKLLLGSAKFGEAALFLSILGVFNILFITCIPVVLYFTRVEYWDSFDDIPWANLCGFSVLLLSKWHQPQAGAPASSGRHAQNSAKLLGRTSPWSLAVLACSLCQSPCIKNSI